MSQGTFMSREQQPLTVRIYSLLSIYDVEIAETFFNRCPSSEDIRIINAYLRDLLSSFNTTLINVVNRLPEIGSIDQWIQRFNDLIVPILINYRFDTSCKLQPLE